MRITGKLLLCLVVGFVFFMSLNVMGYPRLFQKYGVALKGYDSVAYFAAGKATRGMDKYRFRYRGTKWYFSSRLNRNKFISNPVKYTPQYGGFCAYAMSHSL